MEFYRTPRKILTDIPNVLPNTLLLRKRELGYKRYLGFEDHLYKKIFSSLDRVADKNYNDHGGIFNLEFSLDGSLLAAACERRSILLHDALNRTKIKIVKEAHTSCVNCITFLDGNTFATGSDDNTVKIWDVRFLNTATRTLQGHSNWVKNIEYSSKEQKLLTSAFDGSIYAWDMNSYTEQGALYERVFVMDGLMRTKLTPDDSKLVICSTNGYILIIHNLQLDRLLNDLRRFTPNIYRLMQLTEQSIPIAESLNPLFSPYRRVNRVEMITDFPNQAEVISSLKIHPMGWCALTRNISGDEMSEWTSVHDIQERELDDYLKAYSLAKRPELRNCIAQQRPVTLHYARERTSPMDLWMGFVSNHNIRTQRMLAAVTRRGSGIRTTRAHITVYNSGILSPEHQRPDPLDLVPTALYRHVNEGGGDEPTEQDSDVPPGYCKIVQNLRRMTHYVEEPNAGKGFIKELCFSPDGRIICSPYHTGVRLFSFNKSCSELSTCVPTEPQQLHKFAQFQDYHTDIVVSCKFNPHHSLLVSGCLAGRIVWYSPVF